MKLLSILIISLTLSACAAMGTQKGAQLSYSGDYGGYLTAKDSCKKHNFNEYKGLDSGGKSVSIRFAADCGDIAEPIHNGGNVATSQAAVLGFAGNVVGASISAISNYEVSKDNNRTRVNIAETNRLADASRDNVLLQAIQGNSDQTVAIQGATEAINTQSESIDALITILTPETESEAEAGDAEAN